MNYLFEVTDPNLSFCGERFFVQCDSVEEAFKIIKRNTWYNLDDVEYIDVYTDDEAEWMGYDTF